MKVRAVCPWCLRDYQITLQGEIRAHRIKDGNGLAVYCMGSGRRVNIEDVIRDD